jgi:hypothetical protein
MKVTGKGRDTPTMDGGAAVVISIAITAGGLVADRGVKAWNERERLQTGKAGRAKDNDDVIWVVLTYRAPKGRKPGALRVTPLEPTGLLVALTGTVDEAPTFESPPAERKWSDPIDGVYEAVAWFKRRAGGRLNGVRFNARLLDPHTNKVRRTKAVSAVIGGRRRLGP